MGAQLASKGSFSDLNLTPLIDIVLVVLIIMMVSIPRQVEEMGVKMPSMLPPPPPTTEKPDQLVVAIYGDGQLALNRRVMKEQVLFYEVTRRLRPMTKKNVFIDGHPDADYARVVDMMDLAREAGAAKVGLAKMKPNGPLEATSVHPGSAPRGVIVGTPKVVGAISAKTADKVLQPAVPSLRACYERRLQMKSDLSGRIFLRITVGPDGAQMADPEITQTTLDDDQVAPCVLEVAKNLEYSVKPPGPGKTAVIRYPLLFSPG